MKPPDYPTAFDGSVLRALNGEVCSRMVAFTAGFADRTITLRSYVDGPVRPDDVATLSVIATEVITDYCDDGYDLIEQCWDAREQPPVMLDFWAYRR